MSYIIQIGHQPWPAALEEKAIEAYLTENYSGYHFDSLVQRDTHEFEAFCRETEMDILMQTFQTVNNNEWQVVEIKNTKKSKKLNIQECYIPNMDSDAWQTVRKRIDGAT